MCLVPKPFVGLWVAVLQILLSAFLDGGDVLQIIIYIGLL